MAPRNKNDHMWEDKEILFDLPYSYLRLRPGEKVLERFDSIEDTKGNNGVKGRMVITNLRLIWHAVSSPRINLCKHDDCCLNTDDDCCVNTMITVSYVSTLHFFAAQLLSLKENAHNRAVNSGLRGATQALYLLGRFNLGRYEFIFTELRPDNSRHAAAVLAVHKAYNGSRMYRELKLRCAIIHNKQLRMLPGEAIALNEHSVWNLSSDTGNLGTLLASNVRVVWFAQINDAFNVSLPYVAIESIAVRASKFGEALVISSRPSAGGYVLGFRVDPPARLEPLQKELSALHHAYSSKPIFGVQYSLDDNVQPTRKQDDLEDLEEIGEPRGEMGPALYLASQAGRAEPGAPPPAPVFSPYLGLAIEPLKEGFTLKGLFEVQTS